MNAAVRAVVRMGSYVGAKVYFIHEVSHVLSLHRRALSETDQDLLARAMLGIVHGRNVLFRKGVWPHFAALR